MGARQGVYIRREILKLIVRIPVVFLLRYLMSAVTLSRQSIRAHYEQMSVYERNRLIGLKEAEWTNRRITRILQGESMTKEIHLVTRLCGLVERCSTPNVIAPNGQSNLRK
ncbi:hypothetical protein TNCV_4002551 [Trichonephila clavipes]|uniref:Uncharacterized protein n=1 Tax=Trichonephila clavipes TaxID=2585209 RepID=A0A8X6RN03_TRICX|nr:hypothetical protein TNCV_4002551 [Trichonephila clavipes]